MDKYETIYLEQEAWETYCTVAATFGDNPAISLKAATGFKYLQIVDNTDKGMVFTGDRITL